MHIFLNLEQGSEWNVGNRENNVNIVLGKY